MGLSHGACARGTCLVKNSNFEFVIHLVQECVEVKAAIALIPSSRTSVHQQVRTSASRDLEIAVKKVEELRSKLFAKFCVRQKFASGPGASAPTGETASCPTKETAGVDDGEGQEGSQEINQKEEEKVDQKQDPDHDEIEFALHVKGHRTKVAEEFSEPCAFADKKVLPYLPYALRVSLIYFADLVTLSILDKALQQDPALESSSEDQNKLHKIRLLAMMYCDAVTDITKCPPHATASQCLSVHLTLVPN